MKSEKLNFIKTVYFLSEYLKGNYFKFFAFCIGWLTQSAITIITPIVFGVMIDQIVYYGNIKAFFSLGELFVIITLFGCILYYFIYEIYAHILVTFTSNIKKDVFVHLIDAEAKVLNDTKTGEMVNLIQTYPNDCMNFVVRNIIHNLNGIMLMFFSAFYIFRLDWRIGCFVIVFIPIGTAINLSNGKKIRFYGDQKREKNDSLISWILEMISGARDIRLLGTENYVTEKYASKLQEINKVNNKSKFYIATAENVIDGSNMLIEVGIYVAIAILMKKTGLSIGNIMIVMAYFALLRNEVKQFCVKWMDLQNRIAGIQRIKDFLGEKLEKDREGKDILHVSKGKIEIENAAFAYEDNKVIDEFNCAIKAGERVALVGKSGCGKTTLANLILGFYKLNKGSIKVDGKDLSECSLTSIRNEIGIVQQSVFLIDGTIRENLLLGKNDVEESQIVKACEQAGLGGLINDLTDGIDTVIGTKGINLSGGEKQRLALARIYLRNPQIIIFDEATSALDSETENIIFKEWDKVLSNRTSIIIAHRFSSVLQSDKVLLLEDGQITVEGKPAEVIQNNVFQELFAMKKEA